jgi:hypothetical protein
MQSCTVEKPQKPPVGALFWQDGCFLAKNEVYLKKTKE